jgi:uncharacterized lipoprotein YddW (UPF0748 family)
MAANTNEICGVWISYLEFDAVAKGKSQSAFTANIDEMFSTIAQSGLNTVYVQVRPFGDALYPSQYFPWSYILTGTEGQDPGYDPLSIMVKKAKNIGLASRRGSTLPRACGWLHPKSIARRIWRQRRRMRRNLAVRYNGGLFYNPACQDARDLITQGVVEIVKNSTWTAYTSTIIFTRRPTRPSTARITPPIPMSGGKLRLADRRRQNVDKLVKQVYQAVQKPTERDVRHTARRAIWTSITTRK